MPALDVAIGLVFIYVLLSFVCSTINESISTAVGLRARLLHKGILNLLSAAPATTDAGVDIAKKVYGHPLVQGLIRPGRKPDPIDPRKKAKPWRKPPYPSYLPSRTFVAALTDLARDAETKIKDADSKDDSEEEEAARARVKAATDGLETTLAALPNKQLSEAMLALYRTTSGEAKEFQHAAEQWFDDSMERVSGWYRRKVQLMLFVIATIVVVLLNADTLTTGRVLWRDDATRAAIVVKAEAAANGDQAEIDDAVKGLDVPLGWNLSTGDGPTQIPNDWLAFFAKIIGLGLTIGAVMLGAPFWFDPLSKVARIRSTGAPPRPATHPLRRRGADPRQLASAGNWLARESAVGRSRAPDPPFEPVQTAGDLAKVSAPRRAHLQAGRRRLSRAQAGCRGRGG